MFNINRFSLLVLRLLGLMLILGGCSRDKVSGPAPEETRDSMLNLQVASAAACPSITGRYLCKRSPEEAGETIEIALKENSSQNYHYTNKDAYASDDKDFLERQIEKLVTDMGGFRIHGQIEEQLSVGKLLVEMFAGDKYANQLRFAYVGSCKEKEFKLHYVAGQMAIKNIVQLNEDQSITQTIFQLTEDGQIIKESGNCTRVVTEPPQPPPPPKSYPPSLLVELIDKNKPADKESVHITFRRNGNIFARNTYLFSESFMGSNNEMGFLFWGHDDVSWMTPWKVVSIDFDQMQVFGSDEAGKGTVLAHLQNNNGKYSIEILSENKIDYNAQTVTMVQVASAPPSKTDCPLPIQMMNQCPLYGGVFDTLTAVDFNALAEVGPGVASDVASVGTVIQITKSVLFFNGSVDSIRDHYLIPALKAIGQMKALARVDKNDRAVYLEQARKAYSNMLVTSLDTAVKTQRLIPEAFTLEASSSFGLLVSYMGASRMGERLSGQPSWVAELVMPVALSFSSVAVDLIVNTSGKPMEERINRFVELETQLRQTVQKLCDSSPTNAQSECQAALNQ